MKHVFPKFCNPTGVRLDWEPLPDDANRLRALMGRTGVAVTVGERTEAAGRGDWREGSDEFNGVVEMAPLLLTLPLLGLGAFNGTGFEPALLYNAEVGRNGCCCERVVSELDAPSC